MLLPKHYRFGFRFIVNATGSGSQHDFGIAAAAGAQTCSNLSIPLRSFSRFSSHIQLIHQAASTNSSSSFVNTPAAKMVEEQPPPSTQKQNWNMSGSSTLAERFIIIVTNQLVILRCYQGQTGRKYIRISMMEFPGPRTQTYSNIHIPEDGYKFLQGIDQLISRLPTERPPKGSDEDEILLSQVVSGLNNDFQLAVVRHQGQWFLALCTIKTAKAHSEKFMFIPLWTVVKLRHSIARILAENKEVGTGTATAGEQGIDPAPTPTFPKWLSAKPKNGRPFPLVLVRRFVVINPDQVLCIWCKQSETGRKYIKLFTLKYPGPISTELPAISMPLDGYKILREMDRLICELPAEKPSLSADNPQTVLLRSLTLEDNHQYDFTMSVIPHKSGIWHFELRAKKKEPPHWDFHLQFPLCMMPWLRQRMAEILAKERIEQMPRMARWMFI